MKKITITKTVPYKHQKPIELTCSLGKKIKADIIVKIGGKSPKDNDILMIEDIIIDRIINCPLVPPHNTSEKGYVLCGGEKEDNIYHDNGSGRGKMKFIRIMGVV